MMSVCIFRPAMMRSFCSGWRMWSGIRAGGCSPGRRRRRRSEGLSLEIGIVAVMMIEVVDDTHSHVLRVYVNSESYRSYSVYTQQALVSNTLKLFCPRRSR